MLQKFIISKLNNLIFKEFDLSVKAILSTMGVEYKIVFKTVARKCKQLKCPMTTVWIKMMWYIYIYIYIYINFEVCLSNFVKYLLRF